MLIDELKKRILEALKAGNSVEKEVLRVAVGEIQTEEARGTEPLTEERALAVIRKLVKSNQETLNVSENDEQKRTLQQEIAVLESFLPKTLDVDAIKGVLTPVLDAIRAAANDGQATGVAMKHLKAEGASVNGKDVAEAVRLLRA